MKKIITIIFTSLILVSCSNNENNNPSKIIDNNGKYKAPALEDIVKNIEKEGLEAKNADIILEEKKTSQSKENTNQKDDKKENNNKNNDDDNEKEEFYGYGKGAVNVEFNIKKLVDYNSCILTQDEFVSLKDKKEYKYEELCAPKYRFVGKILAGKPDKIEFYSCGEEDGYTLKKFRAGDKYFEYNIANAFDNICKDEKQRSYEMKYYKDGKQLDEINAFKDILPEEFIYKKAGGLYFGDLAIRGNCLINNKKETQICYDDKTKTLK